MEAGKLLSYSYILTVLAILLAIALLARQCRPQTVVVRPLDSVSYWKNKAGILIASLKGAQEQFALKEQHYLDSIAKVYQTKSRYVQQYIHATLQGRDTLRAIDQVPIISYTKDTAMPGEQIQALSQSFQNNYYRADVRIDAKGNHSYMSLQSYDTLTVLWKRVQEGSLLKPRHYLQVDIHNANPHNMITGMKAYRVLDRKPSPFGLALQAGYGFSKEGPIRPYIGIGLSYQLIRF